MPVTMGGVASGMDTDAIIEKLVSVESQPIEIMQRDIAVNQNKKAALETLSARLKELDKAAKELYGFRAAYNDKTVESSAPAVLSATASKLADKSSKTVEVMDIASAHVIATDELPIDMNIPAGKITITVNDESFPVRFKGGSLKALQQRIDEAAGDRISSSLVKTSENKNMLTFTSKVLGKKGEILLSGDTTLLKSIGLAGGVKSRETVGADIVFENRYFSSYANKIPAEEQYGALSVSKDGKSVSLSGIAWREYKLPVDIAAKKDTAFEFVFSYKEAAKEEDKQEEDLRLTIGPEEKTVVQGIELKGYNIERIRPDIKKAEEGRTFDSLIGVGVVSVDDKGKRTEKIYPVETEADAKQSDKQNKAQSPSDADEKKLVEQKDVKRKIDIGKDFAGKKITGVIFYCNDGTGEFADARIFAEETAGSSYEPTNVIAKATDARLKVDGIEITREKNNDLTDVIKGLTLNLHSASATPVTLNIKQNSETGVEKIKSFVDAYNKYIDLHKELTKTEFTGKSGDYEKTKNQNGLFVGDLAIVRLETSLNSAVTGAYPNPAEKPIRLFSDIGVSTGSINAAWNTIKEGKLVINEELLRSVVAENPDGVRMFFGFDSDGDKREDGGMAYTVNKQLDAYIGPGKNIINAKITLENENIKATNERIAKKQAHVRQYEEKLRRKFSAMEETMSGANAQKSWMNQQMGGGSGNSGR